MPGQDKHIYTSEDIRRYHAGAMSPAEMHAMEKAALEDPFLADALEGFVYSKDMNAELASLRNTLQEKTDRKVVAMPVRRKNYGWMRIAALFIVFAAAGWVIFRMNTGGEKELAIQKAPAGTMADQKQTETTVDNNSSFDSTANDTYVPAPEDETVAAASPDRLNNSVYKNRPIVIPPLTATDDLSATTNNYDIADSVVTITTNPVASTETVVSAKAQQNTYSYTTKTNTINGYVTDERNNAIPFASVIARNNRGTLTDNNGRFQLNVPDTVSFVDVNAPGYESRNINVKEDKEQSQIVLKENSDKLDEVVLARDKRADVAGRKQAAKPTITEIGELEPVGGWSEYNSYLADKLNAPNNYRKKTPSGVVELSFDVDAEGNPVNITVEKSLCASCDKEAIRLLKDGPKWKKQEGKGKITIRF